MGDPKKHRRKFSKPSHPWQKERIEAEKIIMKDYGLRRKQEIWKMSSLLQTFLNRAKTIIAQRTVQSEIEQKQLLTRLIKLGLIKPNAKVEDVLNLTMKDMLERRLQTIVVRKHISKSMLQARQLITHEHIAVGARKITSPSYLVSTSEESHIKLIDPINLETPPPAAPEKEKAVEVKAEAK